MRTEQNLYNFEQLSQAVDMGPTRLIQDPESTMGPFLTHPEYVTKYPERVIQVLGDIYQAYNRAFTPLINANREQFTDYRYCFDAEGFPINYFVQIDMVGLTPQFIDASSRMTDEDLDNSLRAHIFEIENSLAGYGPLSRMFSTEGNDTLFNRQFRRSLNDLREMAEKPIALLAVTKEKQAAMMESEFGRVSSDDLSDYDCARLSGFDRFFGPDDFRKYVEQNNGNCDYLLYARTSQPLANLRKPGSIAVDSLLRDDFYRGLIRGNSITMNIDHPDWSPGDPRRINDTKAYLPIMGMGLQIENVNEINPESEIFLNFLSSQGFDLSQLSPRTIMLRAKPLDDSYGCYGHVRGSHQKKKFRQELRKNMESRGNYIIQPEKATPIVVDPYTGQEYTYIDRNFFSFTNGPQFMGGFRSLMPLDNAEARNGRVHGNHATRWAPIL